MASWCWVVAKFVHCGLSTHGHCAHSIAGPSWRNNRTDSFVGFRSRVLHRVYDLLVRLPFRMPFSCRDVDLENEFNHLLNDLHWTLLMQELTFPFSHSSLVNHININILYLIGCGVSIWFAKDTDSSVQPYPRHLGNNARWITSCRYAQLVRAIPTNMIGFTTYEYVKNQWEWILTSTSLLYYSGKMLLHSLVVG
jgi:hypothetical protein